MYVVKIHPSVSKFIQKNRSLAWRIERKLRQLKENPFLYLEHFVGQSFYKLRIGQYRALIDVDKKRKLVFVRHRGHRKKIYKTYKL